MKLQKLCYYAQAWSLVWDDAPLFAEDPWNEARGGVPAGVGCERVISKESMAIYYGGL